MNNSEDEVGRMLAAARGNAEAEKAALGVLSTRSVLVLLKQAPAAGDAAPYRNLVEWKRDRDGVSIVPVFTADADVTVPIPPPFVLVSVPVRTLVTTCGFHRYVINPLSPDVAFEIGEARWELLKACIAEQGFDPEAPSRESPWAFRLPPDELYPVACVLAAWLLNHGGADKAYMYEVTRMRSTLRPRKLIVLGLDVPVDLGLAKTLTTLAVQAGVPPDSFVVRFLPDEPSHQEGITGIQLEPFWQRPPPH